MFNLNKPGNIAKAIVGEKVGTLIGGSLNEQQRSEGSMISHELKTVNNFEI